MKAAEMVATVRAAAEMEERKVEVATVPAATVAVKQAEGKVAVVRVEADIE